MLQTVATDVRLESIILQQKQFLLNTLKEEQKLNKPEAACPGQRFAETFQ